MKYILKPRLHLNLLLGYFQKAIEIEKQLPDKKITLYSYWFDEWAIIVDLVKRISAKPLKVICRMHGFDFDEAQVESGYHLFRYSNLKGMDHIFSVSVYGKRYTLEKYGFKEVVVSKLGVKDKGSNPYRNSDAKTIVSCSALIPLKRVHLIIQLLKEIPLNITWVHFGNGPLENEILNKASALPANIRFEYKGQVDNKEIISFYNSESVDLFINVSELEGIPVSLMEAISFGIPVAGCNICGVPEIVSDRTGILLDKNFDINHSAALIHSFLIQECSLETFRAGVKDFWKMNFNADRNYPDFINKHLLN